MSEDRWMPIESAPKDGTPILVWLPLPMLGSHVHAATLRHAAKVIGGRFHYDATSLPTHWQPLPEPPEES